MGEFKGREMKYEDPASAYTGSHTHGRYEDPMPGSHRVPFSAQGNASEETILWTRIQCTIHPCLIIDRKPLFLL